MSSEVVAELQETVSPTKEIQEKAAESPKKRKLDEGSVEEDVESKKARADAPEETATPVEEPKASEEKVEESAEESAPAEAKTEENASAKDPTRVMLVAALKSLISKGALPEGFCAEDRANKVEDLIYSANGSDSASKQYLTVVLSAAFNMMSEDFVKKVVEDVDEKFDFVGDIPADVAANIEREVENLLSETPADFDVEKLRPIVA